MFGNHQKHELCGQFQPAYAYVVYSNTVMTNLLTELLPGYCYIVVLPAVASI